MRFIFEWAVALVSVWFLTYTMHIVVYLFTGTTNFTHWGFLIITFFIQYKMFGAIFAHFKRKKGQK